MNNTTKGEWRVLAMDGLTQVWKDDRMIAHLAFQEDSAHPRVEAEANAQLIALAGNLNQRYDLSKLEAATERLRNAWPDNWPLAVDDFLRAITRQPAGEKTEL